MQPSTIEPDQEFQERVARKAYEFFENRGRNPGDDVEDWLAADQKREQFFDLVELE